MPLSEPVRLAQPDPTMLREILGACWSRKTSSRWSAEAPSRGQCAVTTLVAHDHLGGDILKTRVGMSWHFYNRVAGSRLDLTADQFTGPVTYLDLPSTREEAFRETDERHHAVLSRRFATALRAFASALTKEGTGQAS